MPQRPRFVLGPVEDVKTESYDDYPENAPSDQIVVEAVFRRPWDGAHSDCHIAEGEKDQEIVAVVPVQPLNLVIQLLAEARTVLAGKNVPLHLFPLPRTELGGGILRFNVVALLDRPASMLKENLRDYRRLGLYVESRGFHGSGRRSQSPNANHVSGSDGAGRAEAGGVGIPRGHQLAGWSNQQGRVSSGCCATGRLHLYASTRELRPTVRD